MAEHKMITIDGIRVRPEDEPRWRARAGAAAGPLTATLADPSSVSPPPAEPLDPAAATAEQVLAYLATASEAEATRVLDAEAAGKNRVGITTKREQLLAAARSREPAGGSGGADDGPAA